MLQFLILANEVLNETDSLIFFLENHGLIFTNSGFTEPRQYRYWNPETRNIDFEGMLEDLKNAPKGSVIILHACAHNPTGCDPTSTQWEKIADVIEVTHFCFTTEIKPCGSNLYSAQILCIFCPGKRIVPIF